jgi:hypothetical protein
MSYELISSIVRRIWPSIGETSPCVLDPGCGMSALLAVGQGVTHQGAETNPLPYILGRENTAELNPFCSILSNALIQLETLFHVLCILKVLAEYQSQCGGVFDTLTSAPATGQREQRRWTSNSLALVWHHRVTGVAK